MNAQPPHKPVVLITGAAGSIGRTMAEALADDYRVVGLDRDCQGVAFDCLAADLGDERSLAAALDTFRARYGAKIAAVLHLAAYFDFTGEEHPLYDTVNVAGTRRLLDALQVFDVEQFVYTSTILVHQPGKPGEAIDESTPLAPRWAYPQSKARAERVIRSHHGRIPYVILRLAGLYDEHTAVPTLTQQIARIYERDFASHVYAGDLAAGQSMLHREDMVDALIRTIERRRELPSGTELLIGEPDAIGYQELQDRIGGLLHGEDEWATLRMPAPLAKAGAWLQGAAEPLIPDAIDHGQKPFIRPFMIDLASDHYALNIDRARRLLGWQPRHRLRRSLPQLVGALKQDPRGWYRQNRITPPAWLEDADDEDSHPEALRRAHEAAFRDEHRRQRWARLALAMLGAWLLGTPLAVDYAGATALLTSDLVSGALLVVLGLLTASWRRAALRWFAALIGAWLLAAPLLFWAPNAALYLNGTLVGALAILFALAVPPVPNMSPLAALRGPMVPPGWDLSPSSWTQRVPIIALAFVGLLISRYLAAYQLGHIEAVWEPWFAGPQPDRNGTEYIITSHVSEAWPVPDAGLGAMVYLLEIVLGLIGGRQRWRTMPWLVLLFGALIVPLGGVSIFFIIIQPIVLGTACTLCLIAAAAMLVQIPYAANEIVATLQFLARRRRAGKSLLLTLLRGDTDAPSDADQREATRDAFDAPPRRLLADVVGGGVGLPWNLVAAIVLGLWLMLSRFVLASGTLADANHLLGALVISAAAIACAEVVRALRWLLVPLGLAVLVSPFVYESGLAATIANALVGAALIALALRRGPIRYRWGGSSA